MFDLKDLPSKETLEDFAKNFYNPDISGLHTWLIWSSITHEMLNDFEKNLAKFNISQTQFFVLILLKRNQEGISVGNLADGTGVTSQTMTRVLDRMERDELIIRKNDINDRRVRLFFLSSLGDQLLNNALPHHYKWVAKIMSCFDEDDRQTIKNLMFKYKRTTG